MFQPTSLRNFELPALEEVKYASGIQKCLVRETMTYFNGSSCHLCKDLIRYLCSTVQTCACLHLSVVWFVLGSILNMCNNEKRIPVPLREI